MVIERVLLVFHDHLTLHLDIILLLLLLLKYVYVHGNLQSLRTLDRKI